MKKEVLQDFGASGGTTTSKLESLHTVTNATKNTESFQLDIYGGDISLFALSIKSRKRHEPLGQETNDYLGQGCLLKEKFEPAPRQADDIGPIVIRSVLVPVQIFE